MPGIRPANRRTKTSTTGHRTPKAFREPGRPSCSSTFSAALYPGRRDRRARDVMFHHGPDEMSYPYDGVDLRKHPEAYRVGRGEQGVFHAEPYKGELLPLWSFKTEEAARGSAEAIYERFLGYRDEEDFVGMDVARKFLQMGYTRSRRYAKYVGGKKSRPREELDAEKQRAAEIFHEKWRAAAEDEEYLRLKEGHRHRND